MVQAEVVQHAGERADKEIEIFKNPEDGEVQDQGKDEPLSAMRILRGRHDFLSDQKIRRGAANHEREEAPVPPAVEEVTR